jgi:acetoin utilization deacetylase AcuC-like enzyme
MKPEEINIFNNDLHSANGVQVVFTKKDGTARVMNASLHEDRIPSEHKPKGTQERAENPDLVHVFDLDAVGWRSIRYDSISSWFPR